MLRLSETRKFPYLISAVMMSVLVLILFVISGCVTTCEAEGIAVIYTSGCDNITVIDCLDPDGEHLNSVVFPYSNMSFDGFMNSCVLDGKVYVNPKGLSGYLDYGKIAELDIVTMKAAEYDFGRVNIISHCANESYICAMSNLNGICYLDRYDRRIGKIDTVQTDSIILDSVILAGDTAYALGFDNNSCYSLYAADFAENALNKVVSLSRDEIPCFLVQYGGKIIFTYDSTLCMFDTRSGKTIEYTLNYPNAFNLQIHGDLLYVGHEDSAETGHCFVEVLNLKDMSLQSVIQHPGVIFQMEVRNDEFSSLYIMDYESISVYRMDQNGAYHLSQTVLLDPEEDFYPGGFFLR